MGWGWDAAPRGGGWGRGVAADEVAHAPRPTGRGGAARGSARAPARAPLRRGGRRARGRPAAGRRRGRRRRGRPGRRGAARRPRRATCSWMPPTPLATTGRAFHMASATVRPKPSASDFCTTTSARVCSALTTAAFSSASVMSRHARWTRRRAARGSARQATTTSARVSAPSGSSETASIAGPAITRCASRHSPAWATKPFSTPTGSLRRSQRETWATTRSPGRSGCSSTMSARRSTRPACRPRAGTPRRPPSRPGTARRRRGSRAPCSRASSWFFAREDVDRRRDDRDGPVLEAAPHEALLARRRTRPPRRSAGRRKSHASRTPSSGVSAPTCERHTTCARRRRIRAASPAVCGSCRITTSPGLDAPRERVGRIGERRVVDGALGRPQRAAVAGRRRAGGCGSAW